MNPAADSVFAQLSVSVIAGSEEHNIRDCLASAAFAGEIIVVCSQRDDATMVIAREFTDKVLFRPFDGFASQKAFALAQCTRDWVLSIDADERVSDELREDIRTVLLTSAAQDGYYIPRRNHFHGRWIRYGGWYPDLQLRLLRRERARVTTRLVHEGFEVNGSRGELRGHLLHYTLPRVRHMLKKNLDYALFEAREKRNRRRITVLDFLLRPPLEFLKKYLFQRAFLDGWEGFIISVIHAANKRQMLIYLWEMQYRGVDEGIPKESPPPGQESSGGAGA
ncbi:MAG: glycosyltransferase family 2 protein [Bacteroidetes bacterium]|nr:glycosyltransferase family 2 protein [Bacteroidota bacterium]